MSTSPFAKMIPDVATFASEGTAILGIKGSGKTYTATWIAENLFHAGVPFVAFDPIGVWRWLRVPAARKGGAGLPVVVAGGEHGDLPLTPASAPAIVEAAMQQGISLVLDLFSVNLSKADWRRIVQASVRLLLHRNARHGLRHVFIEEAAEFVPQRVYDGETYAEVEKLARMGGNARLGYTLINQRSEEVNKAVLELADNLFLHRQKGRRSLENLSKWLDIAGVAQRQSMIDRIPTLPAGECWAWLAGSAHPALLKIPEKASMHPDRTVMRGGGAAIEQRDPVSVEAFVGQLQALLPAIAEEAKANDPRELRAEVARLKRQIGALEHTPRSEADLEKAKAEGFEFGRVQAVEAMRRLLDEFRTSITRIVQAPPATPALQPSAPTSKLDEIRRPPIMARQVDGELRVTGPAIGGSQKLRWKEKARDVELTGPQEQVLRALAWWEHNGIAQPTRAQLAGILGWKITSGHLKNVLGAMRSAELISYPNPGTVMLTAKGGRNAPVPDLTATLQDRVKSSLKGPQQRIFELLVSNASLSRGQIAEQLGWSEDSGHLKNVLGSMRTLELIDYPRPGEVALAPWVTA